MFLFKEIFLLQFSKIDSFFLNEIMLYHLPPPTLSSNYNLNVFISIDR